MYDRQFFSTQLGKAALVSIASMVALVVLSSQIAVTTPMGRGPNAASWARVAVFISSAEAASGSIASIDRMRIVPAYCASSSSMRRGG